MRVLRAAKLLVAAALGVQVSCSLAVAGPNKDSSGTLHDSLDRALDGLGREDEDRQRLGGRGGSSHSESSPVSGGERAGYDRIQDVQRRNDDGRRMSGSGRGGSGKRGFQNGRSDDYDRF
jgi:hypothetical protein